VDGFEFGSLIFNLGSPSYRFVKGWGSELAMDTLIVICHVIGIFECVLQQFVNKLFKCHVTVIKTILLYKMMMILK
jgi:hypothetical protein